MTPDLLVCALVWLWSVGFVGLMFLINRYDERDLGVIESFVVFAFWPLTVPVMLAFGRTKHHDRDRP